MGKRLAYLIILVLTFGSFRVAGQTDSVAMSEEYYKMGMEVFNFTHRKQATELFMMASQMNPNSAKAHFMTGRSIMLTIQKEKSLPYFLEAYNLDSKVDEDILFFIGQAYHYKEEFDSAMLYYERFNRLLARSMRFERSLKINEVNRKLFECRNAKIYKSYPVDVEIANLSGEINSEFPDYAPTISADESVIVFTSRRQEGNVNPKVADDLEYYEDIFISHRVGDQWQEAKNIGTPLNTLFHDASINLSPNGKEMFIYKDTNGGDIYETFLKSDGSWTSPVVLKGEINSPYLENSAAVTSDDKRIYFTSNRPGGFGGTDIYYADVNKRGDWTNVQNLGPIVNTNMDEEDVYISANGNHLFFSSNGHAGMGDLDIYRSTYDSLNGGWQFPVNLGYPINSVENDVFFVLSGDERHAYISSVKLEGKGEQDIYKVNLTNWKPVYSEELMAKLEADAGHEDIVFEDQPATQTVSASNNPVDIIVSIVQEKNGQPVNAKLSLKNSSDSTLQVKPLGKGSYQYQLTDFDLSSLKFKITVPEPPAVASTPLPKVIPSGTVDREIRTNTNYILNVYFEMNSDVPKSTDDVIFVETLMREKPEMMVEISGHTDNTGGDAYNQKLSQRRADGVKRLLINSGIDPSRINSVGYGESKPIADNNTFNGRKLNRRIEFIIVEN
ncbi:MAG: OmpA family protein [Flammeovirgaceae bacterium]|nr:OmpA family protein [Flammeovirgaceae bacterium]